MKSQKRLLSIFAVCAMVMSASVAMAHDLWLSPQSYNLKAGDTLKVLVGFGHKYTASRIDEKMRPGFLQEVTAIGPDGKVIKLEKKSDDEYALQMKVQGSYLISAQIKPIFMSRVEGKRKRGNKKNLKGVEQCTRYNMVANAPVFAGDAGKKAAPAPSGQELKLQPLADIAKLKQGDTLPVKVTLKGAPAAGVMVRATYAGYEPSPEALAKAKQTKPGLSPKEAARQRMMQKMALHNPVSVKADAQGKASIKLSSPGWWLVSVSGDTPYPDAATCDKNIYKTTYTFEVR